MQMISLLLMTVGQLVLYATFLLSFLLLLRMLISWLNLNPFSSFAVMIRRFTEPLLRPLRSQVVGGVMRFDLVPIVMIVLLLVMGFFVSNILAQLASTLEQFLLFGFTPRFLAVKIIELSVLFYIVMIFIRILIPMMGVSYYNRFASFTYRVTEPLLRPLRRRFVAGMLDFSLLIAMVLVQIAGWLLISIVQRIF